jgi:hypothetical protein
MPKESEPWKADLTLLPDEGQVNPMTVSEFQSWIDPNGRVKHQYGEEGFLKAVLFRASGNASVLEMLEYV